MKCLRLFMLFEFQWMSAILLSILATTVSAITSSSSPQPHRYHPSRQSSSPPPPRRVWSNAGIHEVAPPNLGRPGTTPPPPPVIRYHPVEIPSSGFRPILSTTKRPSVRRRQPEPLDYGTDIITIYDLDKNRRVSLNNDTFLRTVSSSLQVQNGDKNGNKPVRGRVYDDVIYDIIPSSDNNNNGGDSSSSSNNQPSETVIDVRRIRPYGSSLTEQGWRKLPVTYLHV